MTAEIVYAAHAFQKRAKTLNDKRVHCVSKHTGDYMLLKVGRPSASKANEIIAVPFERFPNLDVNAGDMVRFKLRSELTSENFNTSRYPIVHNIEILSGKIYDVGAEFVSAIYDDPNHPLQAAKAARSISNARL